jgi:hypothetical protein
MKKEYVTPSDIAKIKSDARAEGYAAARAQAAAICGAQGSAEVRQNRDDSACYSCKLQIEAMEDEGAK